ncbi:hypothetical protein E2C01_018148 [Portunus trituberculatus]|uniref:Uncharacterized protein n=1 Tax=Portunus trituberculatus TaxID=210409 RepID=A0A5B7DUA1_PORTR|nr:hypothetical protein [Portunus trituberculatus]
MKLLPRRLADSSGTSEEPSTCDGSEVQGSQTPPPRAHDSLCPLHLLVCACGSRPRNNERSRILQTTHRIEISNIRSSSSGGVGRTDQRPRAPAASTVCCRGPRLAGWCSRRPIPPPDSADDAVDLETKIPSESSDKKIIIYKFWLIFGLFRINLFFVFESHSQREPLGGFPRLGLAVHASEAERWGLQARGCAPPGGHLRLLYFESLALSYTGPPPILLKGADTVPE